MIKEQALWQGLRWISVNHPDEQDFQQLKTDFQLSKHYLSYIKDPRERARFDYDSSNDCGLLIFRTVNGGEHGQQSGEYFETVPFCVIFRDNVLITVTHARNDYITKMMSDIVTEMAHRQNQASIFTLTFRLVFELNEACLDRIDEMNKSREALEAFQRRPSNKQITQLSNLDKRFIYLKTATNNNVVAINQLQAVSDATDNPLELSEIEARQLKDLTIEVEQSREMASLASEIVEGVVANYNNILDNSINNTMRLLTVWSLALAVPPVVSGFWGMNMPLPLTHVSWGWWFSIVLSVVPIIGLIWYLKNHHDI